MSEQIKAEMDRLVKLIRQYNYEYYVLMRRAFRTWNTIRC